MDREYYNKVCIAYQNLSERFHGYTKHYIEGYVVYNKNLSMFQAERGQFLQQFEGVPFNMFFKQGYLDKFSASKFYDTPSVKFEENTVSIHYDTYMVLFYSLIDKLKDNIRTFIEIINSNEFEQSFNGLIRKDKYTIRYSLSYHDKIYPFLVQRVPLYGFIYHLFHLTNSGMMQVDENYMVISIERITNILKANEEIYDFTKFEIK